MLRSLKNNMKIQNIIWDLSGTLFRPLAKEFDSNFAPNLSLLLYLWSGKNTITKYDQIALDILYKTEPQPKKAIILLHNGEPVPQIICLWLSGKISAREALKKTLDVYQKNINKTNLNYEEKELVKNMIKTSFDPKALAKSMQPIDKMKDLVDLCYKQKKYILFALSNWDSDSLKILSKSKHGHEVLKYFNLKNIVISAQAGFLKPEPGIYKYFVKKYNIKPNTSIFIDDQIENLTQAEKYGIIPIHFNNAKKVKEKLVYFNVIS